MMKKLRLLLIVFVKETNMTNNVLSVPQEYYDLNDSDNVCYLCGNPNYELLYEVNHFDLPFVFKKCQCGLIKQTPMPNKHFFEWFFNSASKVYLVLLWVLLTFYAISSMHQFWIQKKKEAPLLENAWEMTRILNSETPEGKTLVSEEPLVNLLLPVDGRNGTLWISRFSNRVSQETILEALALYAHIFNWTEKEYLSLIMPGEIQQQGVRAIANLSREKIRSSGVGYWLIMGKSSLSDSNAASSYKEKARNIFQNLELKTALRRFKVYKIFSKGPLADWVPVKSKTTHELGNLYFTGQ